MRFSKSIILLVVLGVIFHPKFLKAQDSENSDTIRYALTLMSYNLKFASPTFEPSWDIRKEWQVEMIKKYSPDIIGTQEGLKGQIDFLQDELPDYVVVGEGRKGGDADEHMAVFFKRDKFRLREMGSFQLSSTPEIIGSGPEINPRMVTWIRLAVINRDSNLYPQDYRGNWANTKEFYVFNTHLFNGKKDTLARRNAARLILDRVKKLDRFGEWTKDRPVFLMGDFNCLPGSPPYNILVKRKDSNKHDLFEDSIEGGLGIDWILHKGNTKVLHYEKVDFNVTGVYPSDHKPVFVEMELLN
jgi:endonuclease/exonuclease/phosphatase family metal-dependent hydrolase